jgi:hypothetical protein
LTGSGSKWISAHIFQNEGLERLLVSGTGPLVSELTAAGVIDGAFFLRYWDGGPHIRLRIHPANSNADVANIKRSVRDRIGDYLRLHSAPDTISAATYRRYARKLATREGENSYHRVPCPNNSMMFVPYRPEHDRYGRGVTIAAVERHFVRSSDIALGILTNGVSETERITAAAAFLLLTWFCGAADPSMLIGRTPPAELPDPPAELIALAHQMWSLSRRADALPPGGTLVDWAQSIGELRKTLQQAITADPAALPTGRWVGGQGIDDPPNSNDRVAAVLDMCAHLLCNRIGISPLVEEQLRKRALWAVAKLGKEAG